LSCSKINDELKTALRRVHYGTSNLCVIIVPFLS